MPDEWLPHATGWTPRVACSGVTGNKHTEKYHISDIAPHLDDDTVAGGAVPAEVQPHSAAGGWTPWLASSVSLPGITRSLLQARQQAGHSRAADIAYQHGCV